MNNSLMINLSNHPTTLWSDCQVAEARKWGELMDMPFPKVDPHVDSQDITGLVDEYSSRILALARDHVLVVHVMGEMTFTYRVVARLKAAGIECVASTTERKVIERADGTKISSFQFVRFRAY